MATLYTETADLSTGSVRRHKARTTDALAVFDVMGVRRMLIGEKRMLYLKALEKITVYIDPVTLQIRLFDKVGRLPVKLVVKKQSRGKRLFWSCPRSGKAVSLLYLVQTETGPVIGSRQGLGLCYPSQALHRTPAYDGAVYIGHLKTTQKVYHRAAWRRQRRYSKGLRRLAREFR